MKDTLKNPTEAENPAPQTKAAPIHNQNFHALAVHDAMLQIKNLCDQVTMFAEVGNAELLKKSHARLIELMETGNNAVRAITEPAAQPES